MSLSREQAAFLLDVCQLVPFAVRQGFIVTGGELWRPVEMQKLYVQRGRSKTMHSRHLQKLAIDLNFIKDNKLCYDYKLLAPIGAFWVALNPDKNVWGGHWKSFKDLPHFERRV